MTVHATREVGASFGSRRHQCQLPERSGRPSDWLAAKRTVATAINRFEFTATWSDRRAPACGRQLRRLSTRCCRRMVALKCLKAAVRHSVDARPRWSQVPIGEPMKSSLLCATSVFTAFAIASVPAQASTWVLVSRDSTRAQYVDTSSIIRDGKSVKVWTRSVFAVPQLSNGREYLVELMHNVYACDRPVATPLGYRRFTAPDQTVLVEGSDFGEMPPGWDDLKPNSVQEQIRTLVCKESAHRK